MLRPQYFNSYEAYQAAAAMEATYTPPLVDEGLDQLPLFMHGGWRQSSSGRVALHNPNDAMRIVHRRIATLIAHTGLELFRGYPGNALTLARYNCPHIYEVDLLDAFGSVRPEQISLQFLPPYIRLVPEEHVLGLSEEEVRATLKKYCFLPKGGLIQGGPASPALFEGAVRQELDQRLRSLVHSWWDKSMAERVTYSRYADNLVFGTRHHALTEDQKQQIRQAVREAGFRVNHKKTRSITLRRQSVVICGVGLRSTRSGVKVFMSRSLLRRLEGMLHLANTGKPVNEGEIHGLMGVFWQCTNPRRMNATEQRIVRAYRAFHPDKPNSWKRRKIYF